MSIMERKGGSGPRWPDKLDIKIVCDADLNNVWRKTSDGKEPSSASRLTVGEALIGGLTREQDESDALQEPSQN